MIYRLEVPHPSEVKMPVPHWPLTPVSCEGRLWDAAGDSTSDWVAVTHMEDMD